MRFKTLLQLAAIGFCMGQIGIVQAEGDPQAGKSKFNTCTGCHSIPGYTNVYPTYHVPRLGGQHADYVIAALKAYRAGERKHPTMHANAFDLSEQDMADIAAYIASIEADPQDSPVQGNVTAGKKKITTCVTCHGEDGNGNESNPVYKTYPRLAGQHEDYLRLALDEYKSGERKNAIMSGMAAPLSEQDIADLAAYYASRDDGLSAMPTYSD